MSISSEITRLQTAKADLKTAIEGKGVTVSSSAKLEDYADLVDSIPTGGSGEWTTDGIAQNLEPNGAIVLGNDVTTLGEYAFANKPITSIYGANITDIKSYSLYGTQLTRIDDSMFPNLGQSVRYMVMLRVTSPCTSIKLSGGNISLSAGTHPLRDNPSLVTAEFPNAAKDVGASYKGLGNYCFYNNTNLEMVDVGFVTIVNNNSFGNCPKLTTIVMRNTSVVTLGSLGAFNGSPFINGGTGGTIYIPKVLYDHLGDGTSDDYQNATNWSTVHGYGTITWAKIEGSIYE